MVLVELHEFEAPGVSDRLLKRFAASHHITKVLPESRDWHECPTRAGIDQFIPRRYRAKVVSEGRQHETPWLFMSLSTAPANSAVACRHDHAALGPCADSQITAEWHL